MEKKGLSSTIRLNRELHRQGSSMPTQVSSSMRARRLHCRKALATRRPSTHGVIVRKAGDNVANLLSVARLSFHGRSEEHTSELQSLMRISYAVFCLKKKKP